MPPGHMRRTPHHQSKLDFVIDLGVNRDNAPLRKHTGVSVETSAMWCEIMFEPSIKTPEM